MSSSIFITFSAALVIGAIAYRTKTISASVPVVLFMGLLSLAVGLTSGSFAIFSAVATVLIWFSVWWIIGRIGDDLVNIRRNSDIEISRIVANALWAVLYTAPAIILVWISFDAANFYERKSMYGCEEVAPSRSSYYGAVTDNDIFFVEIGETRFVAARVVEDPLIEGLPSFPDGPVLMTLSAIGAPCPPPAVEYDHRRSANASISSYETNLRNNLEAKLTIAVDQAESTSSSAEEIFAYNTFGDTGHACHARSQVSTISGVLPEDGECVFGRLPRSCGVSRWIRRTDQCIERLVKKNPIRTYEGWRSDFQDRYDEEVRNAKESGELTEASFESWTSNFVDNELENFATEARASNNSFFFGLSILKWMGIMSSISLIIKTFLTLFSRFIFSDEKRGGNVCMQLLDTSDQGQFSRLRIDQIDDQVTEEKGDGSNFRILKLEMRSTDERWFVYDNCGVTWSKYGRASFLFRPQDAFIRRVKSRKVTVHVAETLEGHNEVTGRVAHGSRVIAVDLEPNQRIIVDLRNVLAFENTLRIKTIFAPRLGAFFQRQLFYPTIRCDNNSGRLLLIGDGDAFGLLKPHESDGYIHPASIGLLDMCGQFRATASLKGLSPYYRPITIGPADEETIVLASNTQGSAVIGFLAKLRGALWFILPV